MVPVARKLYLDDVAEVMGVKPMTVRGMRSRGSLPAEDGTDVVEGHARPWWLPATVRTWLRTRPGKGWRKGV
jgi:hypothetical protein